MKYVELEKDKYTSDEMLDIIKKLLKDNGVSIRFYSPKNYDYSGDAITISRGNTRIYLDFKEHDNLVRGEFASKFLN